MLSLAQRWASVPREAGGIVQPREMAFMTLHSACHPPTTSVSCLCGFPSAGSDKGRATYLLGHVTTSKATAVIFSHSVSVWGSTLPWCNLSHRNLKMSVSEGFYPEATHSQTWHAGYYGYGTGLDFFSWKDVSPGLSFEKFKRANSSWLNGRSVKPNY